MRFQLEGSQRAARTEIFRLIPASIATGAATQSVAGCVEGTYQCTVAKNGTGDYSITYNTPFARKGVVNATALHTTGKYFASLHSSSTTGCRILVWSDAGTASDPTEIHVTVRGFDTADQI